VYFLFTKQMRDSGLPADVLVGKLKKDISFALRRGTIAQVTTALDAAQRAAEDELLALNRRAGGLGSLDSLLFFLPLRSCSDLLLVTMLIKLPFSYSSSYKVSPPGRA
jgi:hypothetical protein